MAKASSVTSQQAWTSPRLRTTTFCHKVSFPNSSRHHPCLIMGKGMQRRLTFKRTLRSFLIWNCRILHTHHRSARLAGGVFSIGGAFSVKAPKCKTKNCQRHTHKKIPRIPKSKKSVCVMTNKMSTCQCLPIVMASMLLHHDFNKGRCQVEC